MKMIGSPNNGNIRAFSPNVEVASTRLLTLVDISLHRFIIFCPLQWFGNALAEGTQEVVIGQAVFIKHNRIFAKVPNWCVFDLKNFIWPVVSNPLIWSNQQSGDTFFRFLKLFSTKSLGLNFEGFPINAVNKRVLIPSSQPSNQPN